MKLTLIPGGKTALAYPLRVKPVCAESGGEAVVYNDGDLLAALVDAIGRSLVSEAIVEIVFNRASL